MHFTEMTTRWMPDLSLLYSVLLVILPLFTVFSQMMILDYSIERRFVCFRGLLLRSVADFSQQVADGFNALG